MKESLIYVVLLVKRGNDYDYGYDYYYHFYNNTNPIDDDLRCIRKKDIDEVSSIEEIENDNYTIDDGDLYKIRLREIRAEYKIISKELLDYIDQIKGELDKQEAELQIDHLLEILNIRNFTLSEYSKIKKKIIRDNKLNDLGI